MKHLVGLLLGVLPTLAVATCNPSAVNVYSTQLAQACTSFSQNAAVTYGYNQLVSYADEVGREAQRLAYSAQSGAQCYQLERDFDYLDRYFQSLQTGFGSAYAAYPNATMNQLWAVAFQARNSLTSSVHLGPPPPPPPPPVTTTSVDCGSSKYKYRFCPVAGRVVGGQLVSVLSHSACTLGQTYGFLPNGVWVDRGCHGIFAVSVQ